MSEKAEPRPRCAALNASMLPHLAVTAPAVEVATVEVTAMEASMMEVSAPAE